MVGAVRFELTTSCTRNKRATRLRYAPTGDNKGAGFRKHLQLNFPRPPKPGRTRILLPSWAGTADETQIDFRRSIPEIPTSEFGHPPAKERAASQIGSASRQKLFRANLSRQKGDGSGPRLSR